VKCANQFVEKKVVAAVQGVDVAADAALPILKEAGIVEIGFFAFSAAMNKAKGDAYFTLFANEDNYAGDLVTQQKLGAKSEAVLMEDLPTSKALDSDVIQPAAKKLGMTAKPFYYSAQTDWTTFAATIMASKPDAVSIPAAQDQVCLAAIPALRAAGFTGYLHAGSCTEIEKLDAKSLDKVINHNEFYYTSFATVPPKPQKDLDTYLRFIKRDFPQFKSLLYTQLGFHIAVQAADMLRQVPGTDITAVTVKKAMPSTKGPSFFRDANDTYDCSGAKSWPGTSACSSSEVFTKFNADKKKELLPGQPTDLSAVRPAG
jgi:branched-chain amino acid transport system substrate-binding protein